MGEEGEATEISQTWKKLAEIVHPRLHRNWRTLPFLSTKFSAVLLRIMFSLHDVFFKGAWWKCRSDVSSERDVWVGDGYCKSCHIGITLSKICVERRF